MNSWLFFNLPALIALSLAAALLYTGNDRILAVSVVALPLLSGIMLVDALTLAQHEDLLHGIVRVGSAALVLSAGINATRMLRLRQRRRAHGPRT